ncbi:unnamed protein product [Urochloa humidicola]
MAIPVARVHLAMAHAALPGLLPSPPKCTMFPLLPSPPCVAIILPINSSPPRPTRADAAGRWDAHKIKQGGGSPSSSSSSGGHHSLDSSNKIVTLTSSASSSRADSEERWDAHKRPASPPPPSSSSSASSSSNRTKTCHVSRRPAKKGGRAAASSSAERWDAQKKARALAAGDELDDGVSSNGRNDVELGMLRQPPRSLYAGPGFIASSPEPSMLPMPSFMILVK